MYRLCDQDLRRSEQKNGAEEITQRKIQAKDYLKLIKIKVTESGIS